MLIFDRQTGELNSREPELLCSFGITEAIGAIIGGIIADAGVGAATAGIIGTGLAGAAEGAGIGAIGGAITGGGAGKGALLGGLTGGLLAGGGALAGNLTGAGAGIGAAGADTGATFGDSLTPATAGTVGGPIESGAWDVASPGLAAGTGSSAAAFGGPGGNLGADTGATFGDSFTPATGGLSAGNFIDSGSFDTGGLAAGTGSSAGAAPTLAPGVTSTGLAAGENTATATALGGMTPTAPGPGALGAAPPSAVSPISLDPTSALAQSGPGLGSELSAPDAANFAATSGTGVTPGTAQFGLDTTTPAAAGGIPSATPEQIAAGDTFAEGGAATTSPQANAFLDSPYATKEFTDTGIGKGWVGRQFDSLNSGVKDVSDVLNSPTGKVLATGVSGLGLIRSLTAQPNIPGLSDLNNLASTLGKTGTDLIAPNAAASVQQAQHASSQAQTLENYLNTGSLPPPVQQSLDRATQSAITNIKAQFASRGMPPNSSAEQQEIAAIKQSAVIQGGTLAAQLYSQGVGLDQLAASIYQNLTGTGASIAGQGASALSGVVNTNVAQNNSVNTAIANLSSALGGRTIVNGNTVAAA